MSRQAAMSQPAIRSWSSSLRGLRRGGVVAATAALALTIPTTAATASVSEGGSLAAASVASTSFAAAAMANNSGIKNMAPATYERRLSHWINQARHNRGIRAVNHRACIDGFAERWARHLVVSKKFYHQDLGRIMRDCSQSSAGEILAMGTVSPRAMVGMWMRSPGHRDIMLSRSFRLAGVSAKQKADRSWIGCVDFGRP